MAAGDGSPGGVEGFPALPDPDAWSARWGRALAVVGLVAWLLPMPTWGDEPAGWFFPWSSPPYSLKDVVARFAPLLAAVGALLVVQLHRGARRAVALTALATAAWLGALWGTGWMLSGDRVSGGWQRLALLVGLLGGLSAAVGNHLRKRAPTWGLAQLLCVVGGALLVLAFLVPVVGKPFVASYFDPEARRRGWPLLVVSVLVLAYGLLGIRQAGSGPALVWLCTWMSRLSRILLVAPPIGMIGMNALMFADSPFYAEASLLTLVLPTVKAWGAMLGYSGGLAVGVAALLECRIMGQGPTPIEPKAAADAFA